MRNSKILFALVASTLLATPALAQSGPIFSKSGGVGSASSTYSGGEPTGGTYSINGTTGGATFNSVTSNTPIPVTSGGTGANTAPNARVAIGAAASGSNSDITSLSGLTTPLSVPQGGTGTTTSTGTGSVVRSSGPVLVTPNLGTPSAVNLTNATGLPLGTGVAGVLPVPNGGTGTASAVGNAVFAAPNGSNGAPSFRSLVLPDLPNFQNLSAAPVSRPINDKLADIINAKDFGAVCNGSTNDATAIGNALSYAGSIGSGVVELPATGLCKISTTLTVPANVTLRGKGGVSSGLVAGVTNMNPMVTLAGNYSSIERMFIDAGTAGVNTSGLVILTNNITSPTIRDLRIDRSCGAIQVNGILADVSNVYAFNSEGTSCSVIQIGNATTLSGTVNAKFDHVQVTSVNTSNRPAFCWDIKDAGGLFISHSDAIYCDVGTIIRPGANQQVIWGTFNDTYLADTNVTNGLVIEPSAASGQVKGLNFNGAWASSTSAGATIRIANPNSAVMSGLNFVGLRAFNAGGNGVQIAANAASVGLAINASFICGYSQSGIFADTGVGNFRVADTTIRPDCAGHAGSGSFGVNLGGNNADVTLANLDTRINSVAGVGGTPTGNSFVSGIVDEQNISQSVASAATINLSRVANNWVLTGTAGVSTINGFWSGREVRLITTTGSVSFTTGGNICNALTSTQNVPVLATYVGSCWFLK